MTFQGHFTTGLLNSLVKIIEAFSGCGKQFHEIAMTTNGRVKERQMNSGPATAYQVRDSGGRLKQKLLQTDSVINVFYYVTSLMNVAPNI
jgi:molybdenum cofactor biosynthesis enzyme MoaA